MNYWEFGHYSYLCLSPLFPWDLNWPKLLDLSLDNLCLYSGASSNETCHARHTYIPLEFYSTLTMWSHWSPSLLFHCSNCELIWDFLKVPRSKNRYIGMCTFKIFLIIVLKTISKQYILKYKTLSGIAVYYYIIL